MLTGDRVRHEFEMIFREPNVAAMLARLAELDVLRHVHPALRWGARQSELATIISRLPLEAWKLAAPPRPEALYFSLLLCEASPSKSEEALGRLNVGRADSEAVQTAILLHLEGQRPSEVVARLDGLSELGLVAAYVLHPDLRPRLNSYLSRWRFVRAETTGDDLLALGLSPGPQFKRLLWAVRAARLDGEVEDVAGERRLVQSLLKENSSGA